MEELTVREANSLISWLKLQHQETEEELSAGKFQKKTGDECFECADDKLTCLEELMDVLETAHVSI